MTQDRAQRRLIALRRWCGVINNCGVWSVRREMTCCRDYCLYYAPFRVRALATETRWTRVISSPSICARSVDYLVHVRGYCPLIANITLACQPPTTRHHANCLFMVTCQAPQTLLRISKWRSLRKPLLSSANKQEATIMTDRIALLRVHRRARACPGPHLRIIWFLGPTRAIMSNSQPDRHTDVPRYIYSRF